MSNNERIYCQKCKHFYITWNKKYPRGCKAYGFKTGGVPSAVVSRTTGSKCVCYQEKKM